MDRKPGWKNMVALVVLGTACAKTESPKNEAAGPNVVEVIAQDYAFQMPDTLPAGATTFHLVNKGPSLHHAQLIRLEDNKSLADVAKVDLDREPPPAWMVLVGGPNPPVPGSDATTSLELTPGNYAVICVIPAADGIVHAAKGMVHALTVVASNVARSLPEADVTLTLNDYSFSFSKPLTAGKHVIKVENIGTQPHEILFGLLAPGKTPPDLLSWVLKQVGPPPAVPLGGASNFRPGIVNFVTIDLKPGDYGIWCFFPDKKDHKPHALHGMMQQIKIT